PLTLGTWMTLMRAMKMRTRDPVLEPLLVLQVFFYRKAAQYHTRIPLSIHPRCLSHTHTHTHTHAHTHTHTHTHAHTPPHIHTQTHTHRHTHTHTHTQASERENKKMNPAATYSICETFLVYLRPFHPSP